VSNLLIVIAGTFLSAWLLFLRGPSAGKTLNASRWMLFAWSMLVLVHISSPIRYLSLKLSLSTWMYCGLWIGTFIVADNVRFSIFPNKLSTGPRERREMPSRAIGTICVMAVAGMIVLAYQSRSVASGDEGLLAAFRDAQLAQLEGGEGDLLKTIATVLACGGLVVALTDTSRAMLRGSRIPLRALIGFASYLSVTVFTAGRPGIVLGALSVFTAIVSSGFLGGSGKRNLKRVVVTGIVLFAVGGAYIAAVVSTRTTGWTGGMENKIDLMNEMGNSELSSRFRESLRPAGVLGDTVIESFYYLSPQLYGLQRSLNHYRGPMGWGAIEFAYIDRRIEAISNVRRFENVIDADAQSFEDVEVSPHFFQTAVQTTNLDFGRVLGLCFVFLCGVLSRRSRTRALDTHSPFAIGRQALICSGAAWSIIFSPFAEQSWSFPLLWFITIPIVFERGQSFLAALSRPVSRTESS